MKKIFIEKKENCTKLSFLSFKMIKNYIGNVWQTLKGSQPRPVGLGHISTLQWQRRYSIVIDRSRAVLRPLRTWANLKMGPQSRLLWTFSLLWENLQHFLFSWFIQICALFLIFWMKNLFGGPYLIGGPGPLKPLAYYNTGLLIRSHFSIIFKFIKIKSNILRCF